MEVALDLGHLIEEVEALGRTEARALLTRLTLLLTHLAKWRWQPDRRSASWEVTIREQRRRIPRLLRKNPVLNARLPAMLPEAWLDAREDAADEMGLPLDAGAGARPRLPADLMRLGGCWRCQLQVAEGWLIINFSS